MSRNTKIVVGVIVGLLAFCCIAAVIAVAATSYFGSQMVEDIANPESAAEVAGGIVDYQLPSGFHEQGSMSVLGMKTAFFVSDNSDAMIMLMEFPSSLATDQEEMQRQMEQAFAQQSGQQGLEMYQVSTEEVIINGQTVILSVQEGTDSNNTQVRQNIAAFEGKSGNTAMLMIVGPLESWDEEGIDSFIDSLE